MVNQRNTRLLRTAAVLVGLLGVLTMSASAMHIAEGYLPVGWAAGWGVVCVPFVVAGFLSIQKKVAQAPKAKILLAMCGAFAFVLSALKIPSFEGSCSHPTGVGLGAILFGPMTMAVLGLIVLLFQALLLAHGGLTTLGANTFSMAIAGPIVSWAVYKLLRKANAPAAVAVFAAAALGDPVHLCGDLGAAGRGPRRHWEIPDGVCRHADPPGHRRGPADRGGVQRAGEVQPGRAPRPVRAVRREPE